MVFLITDVFLGVGTQMSTFGMEWSKTGGWQTRIDTDRHGSTRIDTDRHGGGLTRIDTDRHGSTRIDTDRHTPLGQRHERNAKLGARTAAKQNGMAKLEFG